MFLVLFLNIILLNIWAHNNLYDYDKDNIVFCFSLCLLILKNNSVPGELHIHVCGFCKEISLLENLSKETNF